MVPPLIESAAMKMQIPMPLPVMVYPGR